MRISFKPFLVLLSLICGIGLVLILPPTTVTKAADITPISGSTVTWPTTAFATWTEGYREAGITTRNKYGIMLDDNTPIAEYRDGNDIHVNYNILAHISWNESSATRYYVVTETNGQISGQELDSSKVTRSKVQDFSRTALWNVNFNLGNIKADRIQLCIFDNDSSYGFWKTNGVADDGTYPYVMSTPILGWNSVQHDTLGQLSGHYYAGQSISYEITAPRLQTNFESFFSTDALNNAIDGPQVSQKVVANALQTKYILKTDPSVLSTAMTGITNTSGDQFGIPMQFEYPLPSAPQAITLQYGGLKAMISTQDTLANKSLNTADYFDPAMLKLITQNLGTNLTYHWYYTTGKEFKDVASDFGSNKATGTLGADWMTLAANDRFVQYLAQQENTGNKVYLQLRVYSGDSLVTVSNPAQIQLQIPVLKVPAMIDFGSIAATTIYNGGSSSSQTAATDTVSAYIPNASTANWQLTAAITTTATSHRITTLNGRLEIMGQVLSTTPSTVANFTQGNGATGEFTHTLNAKVLWDGYHNSLDTTSNYQENITWNLAPQTNVAASQ